MYLLAEREHTASIQVSILARIRDIQRRCSLLSALAELLKIAARCSRAQRSVCCVLFPKFIQAFAAAVSERIFLAEQSSYVSEAVSNAVC